MSDPDTIVIRFRYDPDLIASVKRLTGRRWNPERKQWSAPFTAEAVEWLRKEKFALSESLLARIEQSKPIAGTETSADQKLDIPDLNGTLYPFQEAGVRFLESVRGRGLIADEMGLGKTIQAVAWLQLHPEIRPAVIVVPASVKLNWLREIRRWTPDMNAMALSGTKADSILPTDVVLVLNYDILGAWMNKLLSIQPKALVLDECHMTKNIKAKRTKAAKELGKVCKHVICLSGTPITNRPIEFYTALSLIRRDLFPSWYKYAEQYCGLKRTRFGLEVGGATNTKELHERLTKTVMLRRLKKDVLKDLPPKVRSVQPIEIDNIAEYQYASESLIAWLRKTKGDRAARKAMSAEHLARFEALKQVCIQGKLTAAISWIKDYLEEENKLVVFATHHTTIDTLREALAEFNPVVIDGRVPQDDRIGIVDKFQKDDSVRVFIGNIRAAGIGITLTAASATCFVELGWTPGEHDQAEDRVHRIGQEADSVMAYYLIATDTIEGEIAELLDQKRAVLDSVLDGKDTEEQALLTEMVRRWEERSEAA